MVSFCILNDNTNSAAIDSTYNVIKSELSKDYELTYYPVRATASKRLIKRRAIIVFSALPPSL